MKVEKKKNDAGDKSAGGGENDDGGGDGIATILLKLDLHCEGCARKVGRSVRHFEGVEEVKADYITGKVTVKGNADPLWLRDMVERKTKKKVELLFPQPKIDGGAGGAGEEKPDDKVEKKAEEKVEKKAEENKAEDKKPKKAQFNTEVVRVHCDGSAHKVKRFVVKELTPYLKDKLKRKVEAVPPKKADGSGVREDKKKEKEVVGHGGGDGSGRRKKKDGETKVASKSREPKQKKAEVMNKMESHSSCSNPNMHHPMPSMFNQNYYNQDYGVTMHDHGYSSRTGYAPPPPYFTTPRGHGYDLHHTGYVSPRYFTTPRDHGSDHTGYISPPYLLTTQSDHGYGHSGYVPAPYTAPQYFSDENPNACSVM